MEYGSKYVGIEGVLLYCLLSFSGRNSNLHLYKKKIVYLVFIFLFYQLLSEEVFDFSRGEMTQQKIKELKQSLNR